MSAEKNKLGFLKGIRTEFSKITWPKAKEIMNSTLVVLVSIAVFSVVIKLLDTLYGFLLSFTV